MRIKQIIFIILFLLVIPFTSNAQAWFTSGQNADLMISGVDFNNTGGALAFNHPNGLASNGTNLLLCDRFNNRVLVWLTAPASWNTPPDLVLGQQNFTTNDPGTSKSEMNWPGNVSVASNGKLAITDTDNDRLLLWNSFPTSNGQAADISIHLPTIAPTGIPQKWEWPWGIWTDGTRLAAITTMGATILFWNTFPVSDNQQPDYTITNSNFGTPRNISTDGSTYFFVGDHNAHVNNVAGTFFWNSYPSTTNQNYDFYRDEWIKGAKLSNGKLIASGLNGIYTWNSIPTNATQNPDLTATPSFYNNGDGVDVVEANGKIYVCNYNGNDVLIYNTPPDNTQPDPQFALGVSNFHNNTLDSIGYIQNPAFSTDGTRLIITSDFDRRIYVYNNFPTISGQMADNIISTISYNLAAWDNALYNNKFVAAGRNSVCIWNNASNLAQNPSVIYNGSIGTATFNDLKGVALDNQFFYVADRNGMVYIWNGIPANNTTNPLYTLNLGNVELNRLSSDGTYFCVAQQSPATIYIYKVADIALGNTTAWKTISGSGGFLNLPSEAITFNGSLAIANQCFNDVLLWEDINNAPDTNSMIVLGHLFNSPNNKPTIGQNGLFMPGALLFENNHLWVGEHKFSSRILKFSNSFSGVETITENINDVICYPNPFSISATIQITNPLIRDFEIKLYDTFGRVIISEIIRNSDRFVVHKEGLPDGVYFYKLTQGNDYLYSGKLMISD